MVFNKYVEKELDTCERIDIIWDDYKHDSLKATARNNRGKRIRIKVNKQVKVPRNFQDFLRYSKNKQELFEFLTSNVVLISTNKNLCVTSGKLVVLIINPVLMLKFNFPGSSVVTVNYSTQFLQDCDHEEADTRLALHLIDAINHGARNILVCTVDTDVIA